MITPDEITMSTAFAAAIAGLAVNLHDGDNQIVTIDRQSLREIATLMRRARIEARKRKSESEGNR